MDEEEPEAYKMRISYARPPQAGPGSQRVPGHARREQGPTGRRGVCATGAAPGGAAPPG